jgi:GNAT superfamily N-acetyltransferase
MNRSLTPDERIDDAIEALNGKWPDSAQGHYISLGRALFDRREPLDHAFVCTKDEFEDEVDDRRLVDAAQRRAGRMADRMEAAVQWAKEHGAEVPYGYHGKRFDLMFIGPNSGEVEMEFACPTKETITVVIPFTGKAPDFARLDWGMKHGY